MNRMTRRALIFFALLVVGIAGCQPSPRGTVNGTVTLDDKPLKEGLVRFVPVDGQSQPVDAKVIDGGFTALVPVGEMRVEFSAPKVIGKRKMYDTPDAPEVDDVVELLPERFNVQSDLKITVKKGGQDETFRLQSK